MGASRFSGKGVRWGRSRGQNLVEFAIVLPVFLWLVLGTVDFGRGIASYVLISDCAREGARAGIFAGSEFPDGQEDAQIVAAVNSQTLFLGTIPSSDVTITPEPQSARASGGNISVTVTYGFQPITPLISSVVGSTITMTASSTMLIE